MRETTRRGQSHANGPLVPAGLQRDSGWDLRPATHWDFTEGRTAA
jgi:hypothetical protein